LISLLSIHVHTLNPISLSTQPQLTHNALHYRSHSYRWCSPCRCSPRRHCSSDWRSDAPIQYFGHAVSTSLSFHDHPAHLFSFGAQCQGAVIQAVTNSSFGQCFPALDLAPCKCLLFSLDLKADIVVLTSNGSIIPPLDNFMSDLCYKQPCSNETLMAAAQSIAAGCASDLAAGGLANTTVFAAFSSYAVLREVLCLKT
jgi:hypothetical protein